MEFNLPPPLPTTTEQTAARIQWFYDVLWQYRDSLRDQEQIDLVTEIHDIFQETFEHHIYTKKYACR